jgi:hypothetical protein
MAERDHMRTTFSREQLQIALSRWDNEGGAGPDGPQEGADMASTCCKKITVKPAKLVIGLNENESPIHS